MNNRKSYVELVVRVLAVMGMLSPLSAQAAAPVYFDLGGLLFFGALYLFGLIIFPIIIGSSKDKRLSSRLFAAYVIGPVLYIGINVLLNSTQNTQAKQKAEDGEQKNRNAFGKYCKARQKIIHARVKPTEDISVAVRIDKNFPGVKWQFNTDPIVEYMRSHPAACQKTSVKILEGNYDGKYSEEKKAYEPEIRSYPMCTKEKWTVIAESQSRYELVLGEASRKDPVPWGTSGGRWMSASSARIIDRKTGAVLAEDTMYFLNHDTGEGGCPSGLPQLSELMAGVFGSE